MIVDLVCIVPDGTSPEEGDQLVPYVQHLDGATVDLPTIPEGVDVRFNLTFKGQDGEDFVITDYVITMTGRRTATYTTAVFANEATIDGASSAYVLLANTDTTGQDSRTILYEIRIRSTVDDKVDTVLPPSHMRIVAAVG